MSSSVEGCEHSQDDAGPQWTESEDSASSGEASSPASESGVHDPGALILPESAVDCVPHPDQFEPIV